MAMSIRPKRVSDPLDDRAKARLTTGYASSGSEHSADDSCINSSLVHAFFDLDQESADTNAWPDRATDDDSNGGSRIAEAIEAARGLLLSTSKESRRLCRDVAEAAGASAGLSSNRSLYRRSVMARLREAGYNAGICKAKWESSGGSTAGSYEYIDIPLRTNDHDDDDERYIVDLDFASQFAIARSTAEYEELLALLPDTITARAETVRRLVRIVAEAARASLKGRGLSVPPWRKRRYMMAKWFGPYRRTVNALPSSAGAEVDGRREVEHCRAVGFWSGTQRTVGPLRGTR